MKDNIVFQFLAEIVVRLRSKSPLFFKILQWISIAVVIIPGIPAFLLSIGVMLPVAIAAIASKVIAIAGLVAAFLTGLPVDKVVAAVDNKADGFKASMNLVPNTKIVVEKRIELPFTDNNK